LYLTGYRTIPTIGVLFLLQVIAAFGLALAVLVSIRIPAPAGLLAPAAGAGFALSTLGGYLLSLRVGLFGFREVRTTAGIVAGVIDVAAFAALAFMALAVMEPSAEAWPAAARAAIERVTGYIVPATAVLSVVALALLGTDVAAGQGGSAQSAGVLRTVQIDGKMVVTSAKGLTLYWFAPDTPTASRCTGTCAAYWPPVLGKPTAGPGVTGTIGTITRPDGTTQATYDGHPLYTYVGDGGPRQARGNNLDLNGGLWFEVRVSG
jgi:predicted lipoprotein with Yx(FWY)xxD motif